MFFVVSDFRRRVQARTHTLDITRDQAKDEWNHATATSEWRDKHDDDEEVKNLKEKN